MQYILWQDCSVLLLYFFFVEAVNISELIWLSFALDTLSPALLSDGSLFIECNRTDTCNGQTLAAYPSFLFIFFSITKSHASWIL